MVELLIVADDLTGALDTGVQFARNGVPVRVVVDRPGAPPPLGEGVPVLVVDTESRHLDRAEAARRVSEVVRRAREAGIRRFFKKTDSTLRGNVGSELEALRSASGCARLAFVPALPALGRTTRAGVQYVHGRPLHETEFAHDPLDPVRESTVVDRIRRQAEAAAVSLGVDLPGDEAAPLPGPGILVLDAETDDDLRRIVEWLGRRDLLGAVAGTAALARALAEGMHRGPGAHAPPSRTIRPAGPMLVVGGSLHPVSLAQLDHAAGRGFETVFPPPRALVEGAEAEPAVAAAVRHLSRGRSVLLRSASGEADREACLALGGRRGLSARDLSLRVAAATGRIVREVLERQSVGVLVVLGGDTLAGVVRALGCPVLLPRWEVLPGVPVSELAGTGGMLLVSKAGGFGSPAVLPQIRDALNEGRIG